MLSRASRSYCIGLANADHEVQLAGLFCAQASRRANRALGEIFDADMVGEDRVHKAIAERIFDNIGYCAEHPLKRV